MSCPTCTKTKVIHTCTDDLTIGTITIAATGQVDGDGNDILPQVDINVRDVTTGRRERFVVDVDSVTGIVILPMSLKPDFFMPTHFYELSVVPTGESLDNFSAITINAVEYDCLNLPFIKVNDNAEVVGLTAQTVEIA